MNTKDKLKELLMRYFTIGDSYSYNLTRVKEAFAVGTVSLEDFVEFDEEFIDDIVWDNNNYRPSFALNYKNPVEYRTQLGFN